MLTPEELRVRRERLSAVWTSVLTQGTEATDSSLQAPVLESWRRSSAWLSPELDSAPVDENDEALLRWRSSGAAVGLRAVEADVRRAADDGDLVAAVTDESGRIVWAYGSRHMQRRCEQVGFVPGGRWDEASVGTNALALALRSGQPSTVYSAEHFSRAVHGWVCYAVPLLEPGSGRRLGVLDLSTTWDRAHPLAMASAALLGRLVSSAVPAQRQSDGLELTVLGRWQVRAGGRALVLPRRQIEILVLLALHPDGLSLEQLHARLYGDLPVSPATLKVEVSKLRAALDGGVGSRPYRLNVPVDSDVQRVLAALDRGEVRAAVQQAAGPLLPTSESPDLEEWRTYVEVALRTAVLGSQDPETVLRGVQAHPYDLELQSHLLGVLPTGDPRRAAAAARVARASGDLSA